MPDVGVLAGALANEGTFTGASSSYYEEKHVVAAWLCDSGKGRIEGDLVYQFFGRKVHDFFDVCSQLTCNASLLRLKILQI
jgi:hypothetical protein